MSIKSPYPIARKMAQPKPILAIDPTVAFEKITTLLHELESLKEQHQTEHAAAITEVKQEHTRQIFKLDKKIAELNTELVRVQQIQKGDKGDAIKGDKGDTPAIPEIVRAVLPYLPPPVKGDKGDTPDFTKVVKAVLKEIPPAKVVDLPQIDIPTIADSIIEHIIKEKKLKPEHIKGFSEEMASYRNQLAGKHYGSDTMVRGGGDTVAAGTNVTITNVNGVKTISASGGGGGGNVSVYSETPVGLINGSNTTYTTLNNITTVIRLTLNGEDIDPAQYTTSGSGFTMLTAIPASFSGTPFTIVYSSGTSSSTSFYTDALTGTMNGSNTAFTVANTITTPLILFIAGVPYKPTTDFTTATTNVTMLVAPDATLNGQPAFLLHT